jgi:ribose transport system ATP-binding protein
VLVLDEPTSSLTRPDIRHLFDLVKSLRAQGLAIVYISHFLEEVKEISDRFTVLRDGKSVSGGATAGATPQQIIAMMVGRDVEDLYPRSPRTLGEVVLEVDNLAGRGKPTSATLQLRRGEVMGIAGLIGAGRTELLRALFGLRPVRQGRVRVAAYSGNTSPRGRWRQGMGMVSEDRKAEGLALNLTIADNLTLSKLGLFVSPREQDRASSTWIGRLAVRCRSPWQQVGALSGGNQQKVAIARLLHHEVDVLLLDEPTRGIDVGSKAQIYRIIDELACSGKAVLMVSS